jgi:regulatory protein
MNGAGKAIRTDALKIIARRQHSESELSAKLSRKGYHLDEVQKVINEFKKIGYINDYEFATHFTEKKRRTNRYGKKAIASHLKAKGVSNDIIQKAVIESSTDAEEFELAKMAAEKNIQRWHAVAGDNKEKLTRRLAGYLQRKGFSQSVILRTLREIEFLAEETELI